MAQAAGNESVIIDSCVLPEPNSMHRSIPSPEDSSDGDSRSNMTIHFRGNKRRRTVSFSHYLPSSLNSLPTPLITPPSGLSSGTEFPLPLSASLVPAAQQPQKTVLVPTIAPVTPPASPDDPDAAALLSRAIHVLSAEAYALAALMRLYQTDNLARTALVAAVEAIVQAASPSPAGEQNFGRRGKLIACAVGKSAFVARKLVATLKSLGVPASFMHAAEAVHGDLGDVSGGDVVLFVSFSGRTRELVEVARHLPLSVTVIALTGWTPPKSDVCATQACPLFDGRSVVGLSSKDPNAAMEEVDGVGMGILLPAPIHESEESTFGVSAPTTSTTVAMAVCDMLALTVTERIHGDTAAEVFARNHPGGSIGARLKS